MGICEAWKSSDINRGVAECKATPGALLLDVRTPEEYRESVTYMNPGGAFEWVSSMGRWRFGREIPAEAVYAVVLAEKAFGLPVEAQFGHWAVVNTGDNN